MARPQFKQAIQAVMIDLDGTLIDTLPDFDVVLNRVLREMNLSAVSINFIERTIGRGSQHLVQAMLNEVQAPERFDQAWCLYERYYAEVNGRCAKVYPGVIEGLQALRALDIPLACLTNKPIAFARPLLEQKGLDIYFSCVFGGDSFARKKPDPLPLQQTCLALGTRPEHTLMLGDSANDAQAARAAACSVVLVNYGYNHGQPVDTVDCDGIVERIDELPSYLNRI